MSLKSAFMYLFVFLILEACGSSGGENNSVINTQAENTEIAEISFREYEYDFGKIAEGEKVGHIFVFENKGPGNLVISSASTSCGCTVTKYDKNPIPAGKSGSLEVVFDSGGRNGKQTKTVSVHSNSKNQVVILKITAEVMEGDNK